MEINCLVSKVALNGPKTLYISGMQVKGLSYKLSVGFSARSPKPSEERGPLCHTLTIIGGILPTLGTAVSLSRDMTGVPRRGLFLDYVLHGSPASMSESLSLGSGAFVASTTVGEVSMT